MLRAAHEGREPEPAAYTPPFSWPTRIQRPREMLTISGADWFSRRGRYLPTTRDIYEPIIYHLGMREELSSAPPSAAFMDGTRSYEESNF